MTTSAEKAARAPRTDVRWPASLSGDLQALVTNFSPTGLYLKMDGPASVGETVRLFIDIQGPGSDFKLVVSGIVARMENADGSVGIGIKFTDNLQLLSSADEKAFLNARPAATELFKRI